MSTLAQQQVIPLVLLWLAPGQPHLEALGVSFSVPVRQPAPLALWRCLRALQAPERAAVCRSQLASPLTRQAMAGRSRRQQALVEMVDKLCWPLVRVTQGE